MKVAAAPFADIIIDTSVSVHILQAAHRGRPTVKVEGACFVRRPRCAALPSFKCVMPDEIFVWLLRSCQCAWDNSDCRRICASIKFLH